MEERTLVILKDKVIATGTSPIFDENYQRIGKVHYNLFSRSGKIEISRDNEVISIGKSKWFTVVPTWEMEDAHGKEIGTIIKEGSFFRQMFRYVNSSGKAFLIEGDIWGKNFDVTTVDEKLAIKVSTLSNVISLRPHTFAIGIDEEVIPKWEAINVIQGVRALLKKETLQKNN